jgi:hypothetical protein
VLGFFWSLTVLGMIKGATNFSEKKSENPAQKEGWHRLLTIHSKNKYGYHTRWMSDFDIFLESMLNEQFIEDSPKYYADVFTSKEIEDQETGLSGDMSHADVRHMNHDKHEDHAEPFKCTANPDRCATNYPKSDALSCYKILPKGQMPHV